MTRHSSYGRQREQTRQLRQWLVHHAGCVYRNCRELAQEAVENAQMGYTEAERRVRVPRSLRRFAK